MLMKDEIACLKYLSNKMEATGTMIGEAIAKDRAKSSRGYAMIGNSVARGLCLNRGGLTSYVPELKAWAITTAGHAALRR